MKCGRWHFKLKKRLYLIRLISDILYLEYGFQQIFVIKKFVIKKKKWLNTFLPYVV
jgi:hypothetical protein